MKSNSFSMASLATGLLALSTLMHAQTPVRDSDNEARNAYQESCQAEQRARDNVAGCSLPTLPTGKRLAIRYVAGGCREVNGTTRNQSFRVSGELGLSDEPYGPELIPQRISSATTTRYLLAQPVFLHADQPPGMSARWEGEGSLACGFTVFGYLVDKPLLVK